MSNPIPSQIALSAITNGTLADGSVVQSNYAAIQTALNALIAALSNGTAGQFLQAVDGSDVVWGNAADKSSAALQSFTGGLQSAGGVQSVSPSGGVGYATGAGGTTTEATQTATINKPVGKITLTAHTVLSGAQINFTISNSTVAATDVIIVNFQGGGAGLVPYITLVTPGTFTIQLYNPTGGSVSTSGIVLNFAVIKGVTS